MQKKKQEVTQASIEVNTGSVPANTNIQNVWKSIGNLMVNFSLKYHHLRKQLR